MDKRNRSAFIYLIIGAVFLFGWSFVRDAIWPPPKKQRKPNAEEMHAFVAGAPVVAAIEGKAPELVAEERKQQLPDAIGVLGGSAVTGAIQVEAPALVAAERRAEVAKKARPSELVAMGHGPTPYHLRVLLNTRGASVQQVILSDFQQADREGRAVVNPDGSPRPLHLLPGVHVERTYKIGDQNKIPVPELRPGPINLDPALLEQGSYVMYHYEKENDPQPADTLGNRNWRLVRDEQTSDGNSHLVAFQSELGAPFFVQVTKTFTLNRNDYHIGMSISISPWERPAGAKVEPFRYQIAGPRGIPIEGEWYTSTYRQGIVGYPDSRTLEDPRQVRHMSGSDPVRSSDSKPIRYAGVMIQY